MTACNFVFDIVVTRFESKYVYIQDPKQLRIEVKFNKKTIPLTSSRINVAEFKPGSSNEFNKFPEKLRQTLEECGMPITVKYRGSVLGTGRISFPQSFTDSIVAGMPDLIHVDTCQFEREAQVTGSLELLLRLIIKCDEVAIPKESECRRNVDRSINPQDIMFIMSESQRCPSPCDPCLDTWQPDEGDEILQLDLDRYRSLDIGAPKHDEIFKHNPVCDSVCWEVKKMAQEYEQAIDSIIERTGKPSSLKPPCRTADALRSPCGPPCHNSNYPTIQKPNFPLYSQFPPTQDIGCNCHSPKLATVPTSDGNVLQDKNIRFCPVCLNNLSWLPIFAACPKCGLKPMPVIEEDYNQKELTADNIMIDYLGKPPAAISDICKDPCDKSAEENTKMYQAGCRCTCEQGKLCAYCRVIKLIPGLFQPGLSQKTEQNADDSQCSEDHCVFMVNPTESRPFLARVFSELREIYDLKVNKRGSDACIRENNPKRAAQLHKMKKTTPAEARKKLLKPGHVSEAHKYCAKRMRPVSRRHGWAWASSQEARKYGWRPGAVLRPLKRVMNYFLNYSPENNADNTCRKRVETEKEKVRQLPILNLSKKDGVIFITLRAVNNKNEEMKPIVFKVVKSDLAVALSEIKRKLKEKGFRKCTCHQTLMMCVCRDNEEKKHLEVAVQKECRRRGMENCVDHLVLTDTSDSEMEFDFDVTSPAGVPQHPTPPKPCTVNRNTQTAVKEQKVSPIYPVKYTPYWRSLDCAAGDRYTGTAFANLGETVFEDGLFGHRGGGPHGVPATDGARPKSKTIWGEKPGGPMIGGGRTGPVDSPGGKSFPGAKKKQAAGKSAPIPVRMPKRYYKAIEEAAKAAAKQKEEEKKKRNPDMLKYLMKRGVIPTPWDPNANA
ncbi:uncharacterized protein [Drosophila virilis]|uniref:DUF4776 domain-containing protein n=1 Tax=Drosophila virilis TaxID=7244 RepID=B4M043_DROVI|nr:uncharacterized protein LOC6630011 [Drosophila virilis]EDW68293.2 uncharacterized protein Dvir_GJ22615 [Drosophila virilis]